MTLFSLRAVTAVSCLIATLGGPASADLARSPAQKAIVYVAGTQGADGSFFGGGQSVAYSGGLADTLVSLSADGGLRKRALDAALKQLRTKGPGEMTRAAYAARAVMALVATGRDPSSFGGYDYTDKLDSFYSPVAGYWETQMYSNALSALGALAAHGSIPDAAITWFRLNQCADGGYGWFAPCLAASDVDTTALVVNVLAGAGLPNGDITLARARDYLVLAQNDQGGFGQGRDQETNANSTGLALSAIAALGERPTESPWNLGDGRDPRTQILALQAPEGGFYWRAGTPGGINNYATVQAIPGVAGRSYPLLPRARRLRGAFALGDGATGSVDRGDGQASYASVA